MSHAPKVRARPAEPATRPMFHHPGLSFDRPATAGRSHLLIEVPQTRHEPVEFPSNLFFNDLCGQVAGRAGGQVQYPHSPRAKSRPGSRDPVRCGSVSRGELGDLS